MCTRAQTHTCFHTCIPVRLRSFLKASGVSLETFSPRLSTRPIVCQRYWPIGKFPERGRRGPAAEQPGAAHVRETETAAARRSPFSVASLRHCLTTIAPAPRWVRATRNYTNLLGTVVGDASKTNTDNLRSNQSRVGMCRSDE